MTKKKKENIFITSDRSKTNSVEFAISKASDQTAHAHADRILRYSSHRFLKELPLRGDFAVSQLTWNLFVANN